MKTRVSKAGLKTARYVYIEYGDNETDVVDDETGEVLYTAPSYPRALENALAFARRHHLTVRRVMIPEVVVESHAVLTVSAELERERGDDDGVEYADPRDERDERSRA